MSDFIIDHGKKRDCIAIGRLCIDLNANEINRSMEETSTFTKYVGGSPANIIVALAKLGLRTGFIGKVSDDQFGKFIINYLRARNIDTSNIFIDKTGGKTGLAFTEIKSPTDCSILMYRDNVADLKLEIAEIDEEYIKDSKILLISGTALAASPSREAVLLALEYAKKHNVIVFFDIDYRPYTWKSPDETAIYYNLVAQKCDVIIGTREEFNAMEVGSNTLIDENLIAQKWLSYQAKIVVIKLGKAGSIAYTGKGEQFRGNIFPAKIMKTFGAGDSYAGAFFYGLIQGWSIPQCLKYGSAAASIVISSHSCSDAMPTLNQIETFIGKCESGEIYKEGWKLSNEDKMEPN